MKNPTATSISLLFIFLFIFQAGFSQNKKVNEENNKEKQLHFWIYFSDKGLNLDEKISRVEQTLPANSIKRRRKNKPTGRVATWYDIPVNKDYTKSVSSLGTITTTSRWLNAVALNITPKNLEKVQNLPFVKKIAAVQKIKILDVGTKNVVNLFRQEELLTENSLYTLNYGSSLKQLEQIGVPQIHDMGYTGTGMIVCILDAGFNNLGHEVFTSLDTLASYDFVNNDPNVNDQSTDFGTGSHGTMTLSSIAGYFPGQLIGSAFGAKYVLAKTENTDSETIAEENSWVAAMEWAEYNYGPDVSTTSLGYIGFDDGTSHSVAQLNGKTAPISVASAVASRLGIIVVQSAGNSGQANPTTIGAPADADSSLTVGAVDSLGVLTNFSSIGPTGDGRIKPDIMAMGQAVYLASPTGNQYTRASGTSFSGPIAAGAATLLAQMAPTIGNYEIISALKMSASNANQPDNYYGWGIINLPAAYTWLITPHITHSPLPNTPEMSLPYIVEAEIHSAYPLLAGSPVLFYRKNQGAWVQVPMTNTNGDFYVAEIPAANAPATFEYYIQAQNANVISKLPNNAPQDIFFFWAGVLNTDTIFPSPKINIFPNPSSKFVTFDIAGNNAQITLYSITGKKISQRNTKYRYTIDVQHWKSGIYIAQIKTESKIVRKKFVVTH